MNLDAGKSVDLAAAAISRVVSVFCGRCAAASDALAAEDWQKFDEYFQLQHIAWLNLNALVAKFEQQHSVRESSNEIRVWLVPCQDAFSRLYSEMEQKIQKIEIEGSHSGKLRRHLSAFRAGIPGDVNFLKSA
jgi:hypothetical protein